MTVGRIRFASEMIILVMATLAPWAIGAVDAWAQLILEGGLVLLMTLGLLTEGRSGRARRLSCGPSLALAALALLALAQAIPLPDVVLKTVAPATRDWRAGLVPSGPQRVRGDASPPVPPPATTVSHDPEASLRTAAQLAALWLLFQGVLGLGKGPDPLRRFGLCTVANASLLTLFAISQALTWDGKIYGIRPTSVGDPWMTGGPFVLHNHLAAFLVIGFGLALGFLLASIQELPRSRDRRSRRSTVPVRSLWAGYAAGLLVAGTLASHSRGGILAMLTSTALTLLILRPRSIRVGAGLAVMLLVTVVFLLATGTSSPFHRLTTLADPNQAGIAARLQAWGVSVRAWRAFPVWGTGLGSFPAATGSFYREDWDGVYFAHAESEYLQILTEGGIVGLGLALLALATIARLARRALAAAPTPRQRALVLGAIAGGLALLIECLTDFPMHIPAVAFTAVILAAHLCRLGLEAEAKAEAGEHVAVAGPDPRSGTLPSRAGAVVVRLAMIALAVVIVVRGSRLARAEALVRGVGLPFPGSFMPSVDAMPEGATELNRIRVALEGALRQRPDWAEGHLRLGATQLGLYTALAAEWIGKFQEEKDPATTALLADPLWLHGVVHSSTAEEMAANGGVLEHEPVRAHLVPAARSFLEARRCSPDLALSHARLATLDYLVDRGESTSVHAARAMRLTGYDQRVLTLAGQAAAQEGNIDLAASCWQKALAISDLGEGLREVAVAASAVMSPEQILEKVLPPGGRYPLLTADLLYLAPEMREARETFLRRALERLKDEDVTPAERAWIEGQIRARLGDRGRARTLMMEALVGEPLHPAWREEFVGWLVEWGDAEEASRQARIGLTLHPGHAGIQRASQAALDAFSRGTSAPPASNPD